MSTPQRDPISDSLDRLAGLADGHVAPDPMPGVARRVRAAERRKAGGVAGLAVLLTVGGVGVWQALPEQRTSPPITTPTEPTQQVELKATAGPHALRISFIVTGSSTAYADGGYAGPRSTTVLVDGATVTSSDGGDLTCSPGGALTSYTLPFFADKPLVVPVAPGEHRVEVEAPYCADGRIVADSSTVLVSTDGGLTTSDQLDADLDADGLPEQLTMSVPRSPSRPQVLQVDWGTGEMTSTAVPNTMEIGLQKPVDLDGDGDLEIVLLGGGGDVSLLRIYQADPASDLQQVESVDASGATLALTSESDPRAWQTYVGPDAVYSYRLVDPTTTTFPARVEVRRWTLVTITLTRSATTDVQCVVINPTRLQPC